MSLVSFIAFYSMILWLISFSNCALNSENITFAIVILKPGFYNPTRLLPTDERRGIWAWQGPGLLSNVGKQQSLIFGQHLRYRYSYLIDAEYYPDQMVGITPSTYRCQQTLLSLYAGLYPTTHLSQFQLDLKWQPVPIKIDDEALRSVENCTYYENLKNQFEKITASKTQVAQDEADDSSLMIYLAKKSGLDADLKSLAQIQDNWKFMNSLKISKPAYLEEPSIAGYDKPLMQEKLSNLSLSYQTLCTNDPTCRQIAAGHWLFNLLDVLEQKLSNRFSPSLLINVADSDNVDSLANLLGINDIPSINETSTSGLILEMSQRNNKSTIRVAYQFLSTEIKQDLLNNRKCLYQKFAYCDEQEWCPTEKFLKNARTKIWPNFSAEKFCSKSNKLSSFGMNYVIVAVISMLYYVTL